jgi:hypothetical protein
MIRTSSPSNGHPPPRPGSQSTTPSPQQSETTEAIGPCLGPEDSVLPLVGEFIALGCLPATVVTTAAATASFLHAGRRWLTGAATLASADERVVVIGAGLGFAAAWAIGRDGLGPLATAMSPAVSGTRPDADPVWLGRGAWIDRAGLGWEPGLGSGSISTPHVVATGRTPGRSCPPGPGWPASLGHSSMPAVPQHWRHGRLGRPCRGPRNSSADLLDHLRRKRDAADAASEHT